MRVIPSTGYPPVAVAVRHDIGYCYNFAFFCCFPAERHQHAGREHCRQRGRERGVLRVQRVDQTERHRTAVTGVAGLHAAADVLGERGQRVVLQVPAGDAQEPHHHRVPLARALPDHRAVLQPGGLQQRLQMSAGLEHEPGEEVPSVVIVAPLVTFPPRPVNL